MIARSAQRRAVGRIHHKRTVFLTDAKNRFACEVIGSRASRDGPVVRGGGAWIAAALVAVPAFGHPGLRYSRRGFPTTVLFCGTT